MDDKTVPRDPISISYSRGTVVVLTADSSMWYLDIGSGNEWTELPELPRAPKVPGYFEAGGTMSYLYYE